MAESSKLRVGVPRGKIPGGESFYRPQARRLTYFLGGYQILGGFDCIDTQFKMFSSPILRALNKEPAYIDTNPYRAKRLWPPDFEKLTPKDQFKLERRYRRRSKLAWARPKWTKAVKVAQLTTITCRDSHVIL